MTNLPLNWAFDLGGATPQVDVAGGTVREANAETFPALQGNGLAVYLLELEKGAIRIPHWHPNAAEVDYCLAGKASVTIISPSDEYVTVDLEPGKITVIPQGWFHYISNSGDVPVRLLVIFSNEQPTDIGLSRGCAGIPASVLGLTFAADAARFQGLATNIGFIAPQDEPKT